MASYRRRGTTWRVELYKEGVRESATFPTKAQAVAWAHAREAELAGTKLPENTVRDALRRYSADVAPKHKGMRWEQVKCKHIERDPIASVRLPALKPGDVGSYRDRRLKSVSAATVRREMNLLQSVFRWCRTEWHWLNADPFTDVERPPQPASRKRRISPDEVKRITLALGYLGGEPENLSQRVALAFLFALETAMRSGEILGLQWADVGALSVRLPVTKNGDERAVPLSLRAREILSLLPRADPVFGLESAQRDALFRKARIRAQIPNLHFHDSRAEAIWRLSKKLDVLELARIIGHRDLRSLQIYYHADADELAAKLG